MDSIQSHESAAMNRSLLSVLVCVAAAHLSLAVNATEPAPIAVTRAGTQASAVGSPQNFSGAVRVDSRFQATSPARASGGIVTFEPQARTAWHAHPLGQTLIVTSGVGRVQKWGEGALEIRPGDVVWIPPGVKHWHGASAHNAMSHVAITETLNGKSTDWMELVSDEQYKQ